MPGRVIGRLWRLRGGSNRRRPIPACTLHLVRRRQIATERRRPIDPLDRVLEGAATRVGVRSLEGRLDERLVLGLTPYVLVPLAIADRLRRGRGEVAVSLVRDRETATSPRPRRSRSAIASG